MDIVERLRNVSAEGYHFAGEAADEISRLRDELERERMRLAACGVVALSNTPDAAKEARQMHEDYWSASVSDVARMVDEQIRLRDENAKLRDQVAQLERGEYICKKCETSEGIAAAIRARGNK